MSENKWKVVVCGSTFGEYYMQAVRSLPEEFQLAGIIANGSERSRECAVLYQVPLFFSVEELPKGIDAACVVIRSEGVGGNGTAIGVQLLERGIHVLQEQPVHSRFMQMGYQAARKSGALYQIANLYANLYAIRTFIQAAQHINNSQLPLYINASFSTQVAFPAMDILCDALPSIRDWKVEHLSKGLGPYDVMTGYVAGIPVTIEYNNQINPVDPDSCMHVLHQFTFVYPSGRLTLEDTFGQVTWRPRRLRQEQPEGKTEYDTATVIGMQREITAKEAPESIWVYAIREELKKMKRMAFDRKKAVHKAQKDLLVSSEWEALTKQLGYARMLVEELCVRISGAQLNKELETQKTLE